jgi:hypothetical protein
MIERAVYYFFVVAQTKRSGNTIDEAMKIAYQLFDRSAVNSTKKDGKTVSDRQAAANISTIAPKKVRYRV